MGRFDRKIEQLKQEMTRYIHKRLRSLPAGTEVEAGPVQVTIHHPVEGQPTCTFYVEGARFHAGHVELRLAPVMNTERAERTVLGDPFWHQLNELPLIPVHTLSDVIHTIDPE